ncbi:MAG TPA: hypothetical protein PKY96_06455 [Flavobacteriales bacterium]|nr:hypothetical protein [Flavobacteriales bacterium]
MKHLFSLFSVLVCTGVMAQPTDSRVLEVTGRISDGDKKLPGCEVVVYEGNEIVATQLTDKSGRFGLGLGLQKEFAIVFQKEGFLPKRMLVDTRGKVPAELENLVPIEMEMSMLRAEKYEGADTDVLDFPFAMVKWNRQLLAFVQDQQYTADMMRANGAALLQAGRSVKR